MAKPDETKSALSLFGIFARPWHSRRVSGIQCDNAAELAIAPDWAVLDWPEIDLQHVVSDVLPTMRALDILMAHPSAQDVIELGAAEAD